RCTLESNVVGNRARQSDSGGHYMTQEDWSGTGEASDTPNAGSWSKPTAEAETTADEAWGESAIGETDEIAEVARAVPATTRSSSRSGTRSSKRSSAKSSSSRSGSSRKKKSAAKKSGTKKKAAAKKKTAARKTTARKSTAKRSTAKRKTTAKRKSTGKR